MSIRKQINLVLYQLTYGISCERMDVLYECGFSTIRKYTKIICRFLSNHEGLFSIYIHAPIENRPYDIIDIFRDVTGLPNICEAIYGTCIPFTRRPSSSITLWALNFFNKKKFYNV